jgi:NIMA (never in mitosis gene a)-related kinase
MLKKFEIIERIGKGSFAKVYKVRRKLDKKIYALKKVNLGKMKKKEKENALNEIRILASVKHQNIIG